MLIFSRVLSLSYFSDSQPFLTCIFLSTHTGAVTLVLSLIFRIQCAQAFWHVHLELSSTRNNYLTRPNLKYSAKEKKLEK